MSKNKVDFSKGIYDARQLGTPRMLLLGFQHMFAMFGATVLVPLITGLDIATTLLMAGLVPCCSMCSPNLRCLLSWAAPLRSLAVMPR